MLHFYTLVFDIYHKMQVVEGLTFSNYLYSLILSVLPTAFPHETPHVAKIRVNYLLVFFSLLLFLNSLKMSVQRIQDQSTRIYYNNRRDGVRVIFWNGFSLNKIICDYMQSYSCSDSVLTL